MFLSPESVDAHGPGLHHLHPLLHLFSVYMLRRKCVVRLVAVLGNIHDLKTSISRNFHIVHTAVGILGGANQN